MGTISTAWGFVLVVTHAVAIAVAYYQGHKAAINSLASDALAAVKQIADELNGAK